MLVESQELISFHVNASHKILLCSSSERFWISFPFRLCHFASFLFLHISFCHATIFSPHFSTIKYLSFCSLHPMREIILYPFVSAFASMQNAIYFTRFIFIHAHRCLKNNVSFALIVDSGTAIKRNNFMKTHSKCHLIELKCDRGA